MELVSAHQKALKTISAMEKSEVYTSERFVEISCPGNTAAVKNVTASDTLEQCGVQNSIDVEEEVEPEKTTKKNWIKRIKIIACTRRRKRERQGKHVGILVLHYCYIQWYFDTYNTTGPNNKSATSNM